MPTINISLNEGLKTFVEERVKKDGYSTASEYFRELVRADQKSKAEERLEALLLEGLESGEPTPMTKKDWQAIKKRGLARIRKQKAKKAK